MKFATKIYLYAERRVPNRLKYFLRYSVKRSVRDFGLSVCLHLSRWRDGRLFLLHLLYWRERLNYVAVTVRGEKLSVKSFGSYRNRFEAAERLMKHAFAKFPLPQGTYQLWLFLGDGHEREFHQDQGGVGIAKESCYYFSGGYPDDTPRFPCYTFWDWPEARLYFDKTTAELAAGGLRPPRFNKVFWIGHRRTHSSRGKMFEIANTRPDLFYMRHHTFSGSANTAKFVTMAEHCNWSVLIDIRGRGYSGRRKYLMYSRRPLLLVDGPFSEFWEQGLKPMVHYVPVKSDLSDLVAQAEMLLGDEALRKRIADNAFEYAQKYVTRDAAYKQIVKVFEHARERKPPSLLQKARSYLPPI